MELLGVLFALFYAVILTVIFSLLFRNTGPWSGFWIFFFLLFFIALGAGEWVAPVGPSAWGYYWIPGLFAAIIFALLLAASTPSSRSARSFRQNKNKSPDKQLPYSGRGGNRIYSGDESVQATIAVGISFWILIILLIVIAITGIMT